MKQKPIFNGFIAKQLLKLGNPIVDIQRNKTVQNATVFYFDATEKFNMDLEEINKNQCSQKIQ